MKDWHFCSSLLRFLNPAFCLIIYENVWHLHHTSQDTVKLPTKRCLLYVCICIYFVRETLIFLYIYTFKFVPWRALLDSFYIILYTPIFLIRRNCHSYCCADYHWMLNRLKDTRFLQKKLSLLRTVLLTFLQKKPRKMTKKMLTLTSLSLEEGAREMWRPKLITHQSEPMLSLTGPKRRPLGGLWQHLLVRKT